MSSVRLFDVKLIIDYMTSTKVRGGSRLLFGVAQVIFINKKGLRIYIDNIDSLKYTQ